MNSVLPDSGEPVGAAEGCEAVRQAEPVVLHRGQARSYNDPFSSRTNKTPERVSDQGFWNLILTMTYSHMGKPHTTIGDTSFHC